MTDPVATGTPPRLHRIRTGTHVRTTRRSTGAAGVAGAAFALAAASPAGTVAQDVSLSREAAPTYGTVSGTAVGIEATDAPEIDGRPDEEVWRWADALTDFVQRTPRDGEFASEPTQVRVLFDDEAIYVAVWAFDSRASEIIPGERIRDYELTNSDAIVLIFDTYRDEQNGFVFGTTPAGIEYDGQVANEGQGGGFFLGGGSGGSAGRRRFVSGAGGGFNKNWDGSWSVAASRDDEGWYAEFRIPFNTLRYGEGTDAWGFNVERRIRRLNEESSWAPIPREFSLYRLGFAGALEGLEPPFRRLASVTPYALGATARNREAGETAFDEDVEWGGETKVQITRGLTLDATYNTDFAQVEVDDQQVNLTRFSLLFPEKRPFFLENAGFFTVGGGGADLFFSRRIGIAGGEQVPIVGGGRVSGRAAGFNVGLLHIGTEAVPDPENPVGDNWYSVARIARELPSRSRVGGLFVNRDGDLDGDYNRTYAVDGQVGIGEALTFSGWAGKTDTPGLEDDETGFDLTAGVSTRDWRGNVQFQQLGQNFNPEVGFVPRTGHRYYQAFLLRYLRPGRIFREIRPHVSYYTYRARRDELPDAFEETSRLHVDAHFEWPNGMLFSPAFNWMREGLADPFTIEGTDVTVAPGTYDGWEAAWRFNTDPSADLSFDGGMDWGSFLSGTRRGGFGTLTFRHGAAFSSSLRLVYNDVSLEEGDFETTLAGLNLGYFFTPRIYLQSLVQYSTQIDRWSANVRFGWLNTAGTGLFIVFNEVDGIGDLDGNLGRSLIVKYTHQFNVLGG